MNENQLRVYQPAESCVFRKTHEAFGGLSNMATGYPLCLNDHPILTVEALYQACRYSHLPEVQHLILAQKSPMTAKMKSKQYYSQSRPDWEVVKVAIMRWCLRVKLAQNFMKFGMLLEATVNKPIVEESNRDNFWGAIKSKEGTLVGFNILGRLLMELRERYCSEERYQLLVVPLPKLENFKLLDQYLSRLDERVTFLKSTLQIWQLTPSAPLNWYQPLWHDSMELNLHTPPENFR